MNKEEETAPQFTHHLWIDQENKVLSFRREEKGHQLGFYSMDSMMAYVMEQVSSGYRIK